MSSLCRVQAELQQSLKLCSSCQPRLPLRRSLEGVTILTQEIRLMWKKTWKTIINHPFGNGLYNLFMVKFVVIVLPTLVTY